MAEILIDPVADRMSPLEPLRVTLAAASDPLQLVIREQPFLVQIALRGNPGNVAFMAAVRDGEVVVGRDSMDGDEASTVEAGPGSRGRASRRRLLDAFGESLVYTNSLLNRVFKRCVHRRAGVVSWCLWITLASCPLCITCCPPGVRGRPLLTCLT